jgi:hypothetical protein
MKRWQSNGHDLTPNAARPQEMTMTCSEEIKHGVFTLEAFADWIAGLTFARIAKVYGGLDEPERSYVQEKYRKAIENPLRWFGSLDLEKRRRCVVAVIDHYHSALAAAKATPNTET